MVTTQNEEDIVETPDYKQFKARIREKTGIDLNLYKSAQMHRRLRGMVDRAHVADFLEYLALIERNDEEWKQFLDRMTINVSELFRNPEKWQELRQTLLPMLLANGANTTPRALKVWSAGCSYGAEPYSLAILLDQVAPQLRHTIHATDIDTTILARAREGLFTPADVKNLSPDVVERYFTHLAPANNSVMPARPAVQDAGSPLLSNWQPTYQVRASLREKITFSRQNLLADPFGNGYDLICCRNVVIYFTDAAKETLYDRFCQALRPGGILFVGGTERIVNHREKGFDVALPFFYRRMG